MHRAAAEFLVEFGGPNVEIDGPGSSSAREPFELDPGLCVGEEDRFAGWGADVGCSLFPIRELDQGRFFLGISEVGEVFLVETWVATFGVGDAALESLILGVVPQKRLRGVRR
ncbi:SUKH-3 immunity protein [Lentzea albidocapillata subsp. violacea]|uniref:SUKH-3 immunity protein n=2 Tax=Lentzea albidocapillata TaxID=40571 RepID=A0A1G9IP24_9PSEU|nr:SUKH-3 immunity protein [Lentzea albidocapillata subsp. violacea]